MGLASKSLRRSPIRLYSRRRSAIDMTGDLVNVEGALVKREGVTKTVEPTGLSERIQTFSSAFSLQGPFPANRMYAFRDLRDASSPFLPSRTRGRPRPRF